MEKTNLLSITRELGKLLQDTCQLTLPMHVTNDSDKNYPMDGCLMYLVDRNAIYLLDTPYRDQQNIERIKGLLYKEEQTIEKDEYSPRYVIKGIYAYLTATLAYHKGQFFKDVEFFEFYNNLFYKKDSKQQMDHIWILQQEIKHIVDYEESFRQWSDLVFKYRDKKLVEDMANAYFKYMMKFMIKRILRDQDSAIRLGYYDKFKHIRAFRLEFEEYVEPDSEAPILFKGLSYVILKELIKKEVNSLDVHTKHFYKMDTFECDECLKIFLYNMILDHDINKTYKDYVTQREKLWKKEHSTGLDIEIPNIDVLHQRIYETEISNLRILSNLDDAIGEDCNKPLRSFLLGFLHWMCQNYRINRKNIYKCQSLHTLWDAEIEVAYDAEDRFPHEFDVPEFKALIDHLIEEKYIVRKFDKLSWNSSGPLYYCFVSEVSEYLRLYPSNGHIPWKTYHKIFWNGKGVYDAAQKGRQNPECIRGREKLHMTITNFLRKNPN